MLGCKLHKWSDRFVLNIELIDTCWDVNTAATNDAAIPVAELIDTCWDVNSDKPKIVIRTEQELIDTCWDVNSIS